MSNTIGFGQAAVNNTIDYGQGAIDNTINWGKSQTLSPGGETNITGGGGTPPFANTKSIALDGVDDFVDCGTGLGASLGSSYAGDQTISLWYKRTSSRVENLFNIGNTGAYGNGASLIFINNNLICGLRYANRAQYTTTFDTDWHHALYSVKNNGDATFSLKLYLDGTEVINTTVSIGYFTLNFTNNTTQIGKASTYEFDGNIDEAAFWNSDQSANVSSIYGGGVPSSLSTYSPLTYWRCGDGDTAPTLLDNGSLGNDGTMTNFTTFSTDVPT